jgi:hypothetical protein
MIARFISIWRFRRQLERNLEARKAARLNGQTYVSSYIRRRGTA